MRFNISFVLPLSRSFLKYVLLNIFLSTTFTSKFFFANERYSLVFSLFSCISFSLDLPPLKSMELHFHTKLMEKYMFKKIKTHLSPPWQQRENNFALTL